MSVSGGGAVGARQSACQDADSVQGGNHAAGGDASAAEPVQNAAAECKPDMAPTAEAECNKPALLYIPQRRQAVP